MVISSNKRIKKKILQFSECLGVAVSDGQFLLGKTWTKKSKILRCLKSFLNNNDWIQKELNNLRCDNTTIFEPDHIYDTSYEEILSGCKDMFIDTRKVLKDIYDFLSEIIPAEVFNNTEVWCKNCSFTYGLSLSYGSSDIDYLTIITDVDSGLEKKIYYGILKIFDKYNISRSLPHQLPRIVKVKTEPVIINNYPTEPLIINKRIVFNESIPYNERNIEKWKARIKIKIIMNIISKKEIAQLKERCNLSKVLGHSFSKELDNLVNSNKDFEKSKKYIYRIDSIMNKAYSFKHSLKIILSISKKQEKEFIETTAFLMEHGIVYFNNGLLYPNWDLGRSQSNLFIPIKVNIRIGASEDKIYHTLNSSLFDSGTFACLKIIKQNKPSYMDAFALLKSDSFIVTNEAYRYLFCHKDNITDIVIALSDKELTEYLENVYSNAEEGLDKAISILSIISPILLNKLNLNQVSLLTKYNLFAYAVHNLDKCKPTNTSFYKARTRNIDTTDEIRKEFCSHFVSLLREYYIYTILKFEKEKKLKRTEILFTYFVKGRSLMDGPLNQSSIIKNFLEHIPINTLFTDIRQLVRTLKSFSEVSCASSSNFLPRYLLMKMARMLSD